MNQQYVHTVRLLLAVAPAVFRSPRFALKGGTALNLFVHDMPRLSVDIDVVFTDHTLNREDALRAIGADSRPPSPPSLRWASELFFPPRRVVKRQAACRRKRTADQGRSQFRPSRNRAAGHPTSSRTQSARAIHRRHHPSCPRPSRALWREAREPWIGSIPETCSTCCKCLNASAGAPPSSIASSRTLPATTARFMRCCSEQIAARACLLERIRGSNHQ